MIFDIIQTLLLCVIVYQLRVISSNQTTRPKGQRDDH